MLDFEVHRCSRRCAQTERELKPGEPVYSVLVGKGASVVRLDYSAEVWTGPPDESIGWWKSIVPDANGPRVHWAPNDVMMHYFEQLEGREDQQDVRYVLALLLIRRRIVRLEESIRDERGQEVLVVYSPRSERQHRVIAVLPTQQRNREIQDELAKLLFDGAVPASMTAPATASPPTVDMSSAEQPVVNPPAEETLTGIFGETAATVSAPLAAEPLATIVTALSNGTTDESSLRMPN